MMPATAKVPWAVLSILKHPHRPVPDDGFGALQHMRNFSTLCGPMSTLSIRPGSWRAATALRSPTLLALMSRVSVTWKSTGKNDFTLALGEKPAGEVHLVRLDQGTAEPQALGLEEGEGHAAADDDSGPPWAKGW